MLDNTCTVWYDNIVQYDKREDTEKVKDIYYKSEAHKARFLATIQQIGKVYEDDVCDQEYAAALYILTADLATYNNASSHIDQDGIDITGLLASVAFSAGHIILVQLAGNLFNGNEHIDPVEFMRLDEGNFKVALTAIQIRRYRLRLSDIQE